MQNSHTFSGTIRTWQLVLLFAAVSLALNLLCSCFSPLFKLVSCMDAACFYMAGKAWANGLLPYVDFVDVKGPLLFWIHKTAYQLAPGTTHGIFMVHCLGTFATLLLGYRTARIFLPSDTKAVVAAMLSAVFLFFPGLYICGGQAEELMLPFLAWLIYCLCSVYYTGSGHGASMERGKVLHLGFCMGVGAAATFLIKYNASPTYAVAATLFSLHALAAGHWRVWLKSFVPAVTVGFLLLAAPFALYMWHAGIFNDFLNVYFALNFGTYFAGGSGFVTGDTLNKIVYFAENIFRSSIGACSFLACLCVFLPPFNCGRRLLGAAPASWVIGLTAFATYACCSSGFSHYMLFCAPICIFPCIWLMNRWQAEFGRRGILVATALVCFFTVRYNANWSTFAHTRVFQHLHEEEARVDELINSVPKAKLLYLGCLDYGFGVAGEALPATPEWFTLNGSAPEFRQRQRDSIHNRIPDFIINVDFRWGNKPLAREAGVSTFQNDNTQLLHDNGYVYILSFNEGRQRNGPSMVSLYARDDIAAKLQPANN